MRKLLFSYSSRSIIFPKRLGKTAHSNIGSQNENLTNVGIQNCALKNAAEASEAFLSR
jgi:hypothetical protein